VINTEHKIDVYHIPLQKCTDRHLLEYDAQQPTLV